LNRTDDAVLPGRSTRWTHLVRLPRRRPRTRPQR